MITRRLTRPSGLLQASSWTCPACTRASILSRTRIPQQRALHKVPPLTYHRSFETNGVPGLLSPTGYKIAWIDYQEMMVRKLNELTAGEPYENNDPKDLVIRFARDPMAASLFNHASMAHNNHFFFEALSTAPLQLDRAPTLKQSLIETFGSIQTLQVTMLDTAAAMFGPGFVWLIYAKDLENPTSGIRKGSWRVLTTYLAGTPYPEAGYRQQGLDMNINNASSYDAWLDQQPVSNTAGMMGRFSPSGKAHAKMPPGGTTVMPVLCVNTWEHVWLRDYGMNGKRAFLRDWWDAIDWSVVDGKTPPEVKSPLANFSRAHETYR